MSEFNVAVVGLGYVGLPLAVEMSKYFKTIGFDINEKRIQTLESGTDPNGEVSGDDLKRASLTYHSNPAALSESDFIIIAVPTPVDDHNRPDLTPVVKASQTVGKNLRKGTIVVFESTVYPGVTEDECVPVLEKESGLTWKKDFFVGYSPERINPGDKEHTFSKITKIVSGDTAETLEKVAHVYGTAVQAGVYKAESIKVAEAAKVIENTQRDINIAFMNELKIIFDKIGISTRAVLDAARTKWNFLPFEPGLVGGHCIGVDPYYLAYKAEEIGHHPQLILAGRRINDAMGRYYGRELIKKLIRQKKQVMGAKVLICGITFKENCPDIRNSRVLDVINELREFGPDIDVWDPAAYPDEVRHEYNIDLIETPASGYYDAIVLAVNHRQFITSGKNSLSTYLKPDGIIYDIKEVLSKKNVEIYKK
ncbi:MAG: nucleotide sugar dehydrogenase [Chitinispirillaceae bacterium]|nr:nucleotide sugar dehydrogenase [Chitinispirillaceae bacterium]